MATEHWEALYQPVFQAVMREGRPIDGPVRAFTQDSQGFIWITVDTSLWRWDGYELQKVTFAGIADDDPGLPDITVAKADPNGSIWAGSTAGLFRLDATTLTLHKVPLEHLDRETLEDIAFDYSGGQKRLYLAYINKLYEWNGGRSVLPVSGLPPQRIHALLVDRGAGLWVGTETGLLFRSGQQSRLQVLKALDGIRISALYQDANQDIWIGTAKQGVMHLARGQALSRLALPSQTSIQPWVYDITEARPGELWFATFGNGIIAYQTGEGRFKTLRKDRRVQSSLLDNDIWSLFRDRSGILWVGSRFGANYLDTNQPAFRHLPAGEPGRWLSDGLISTMAALPDGRIAVGTGSKGMDVLHPTAGIVRHLPAGAGIGSVRMPESGIESLLSLPDGSLMVGSSWSTLNINLEAQSGSETVLNGRRADAYTSSFAWFDGGLWLAGTDGLWRVEDNSAENVLIGTPGEHRVNSLLADGDTLWIGTWKGLKRLKLQAGRKPVVIPVDNALLNQKYINVMHKDRSGRLWVGTYNGGLVVNHIGSHAGWKRIAAQDGLPGNKVTGILTDDGGHVWVGTDRGLARIDAVTQAIETIHPEAGAAAAPYENAVRAVNGDLLFGGTNGITAINPKNWRKPSTPVQMAWTAMRDDAGKDLTLTKGNRSGTPALTVPPGVDSVVLQFAALDFINAAHLKYRYRLLGRDTAWRPIHAELRSITLANLKPDTYQLQIGYSKDGRHWSEQTLKLPISVLPTWHERFSMRILGFLLLLAMAWLLFGWWSQRTWRRQQQLEANVRDRTLELQAANRLLQQQAQTIREASMTDPLTGLHNRRFFSQHIDNEVQLVMRRYQDGRGEPLEHADLVLFLIDIDHFKRINDQLGHAAGDTVLIEIRQRLQSVFRSSDYLIRWGGEEFLALARDSSRINAGELAERIRTAISEAPIYCGRSQSVTVTCSIGYAPYPLICRAPEAVSWQETLALADAALYAAKNSGRNKWIGFDGQDDADLDILLPLLAAAPGAVVTNPAFGISQSP